MKTEQLTDRERAELMRTAAGRIAVNIIDINASVHSLLKGRVGLAVFWLEDDRATDHTARVRAHQALKGDQE